MSVSSGSDITIPIQDSPPPPPSPFASANKKGDIGVDNAGYEPCENEKNEKKQNSKEKNHTQIQMNGGSDQPPVLNEALNSELINMNIMNTIPDKPNPEFGPYENPDEYFIAVNQHKKFLRRSEKLYVTKDKRKVNPWRKYMCYLVGAVAVATVVAVAIGVGLISQKSTTTSTYSENILGTTSSSAELISSSSGPISATSSEMDDWISGSASTTSSSSSSSVADSSPSSVATRPPLSENYVPAAADVTITLENVEYTAALNNKSSDKFHELASEIEREMRNKLRNGAGLSNAYAKVMEFLPGSIVVKMRLSWVDEQKDLMEVKMFLSSLRTLGDYELRHGATSSYGLVNHCKFGNYGCSHYCAFDYEQLDFLCTCPENLRLSEDKKLCVENTTLSSPSTTEMDLSSLKPEPSMTDEPEEQSPSEETVTDEPLVIPQSVSTQSSSSHHEHMPVSPTTTTSTTQANDVEIPGVHVTTEGGSIMNETSATSEETHQTSVRDSELESTEGEGRSNSSPEIPLAETTTMYPFSEDDQEQINVNISSPHSEVTHEDIKASTENEPAEIPSLAHDDTNTTDVDQDLDDISSGTEDPVEVTTITPLLGSDDEEQGISNEAPLQRTGAGSDNYSEVEQQQLNARVNTATTTTSTSTTTTAPTPIVSFNSSRYSEENNASNILSSQSNESNLDNVEEGTTNASDAELLSIEGNLNDANNANRSARFEKFGENSEQLQEQQQQGLNASSRGILSNSAEFMVYGDNVLGENGNTRENSEGGTDSGLTEPGSFYPHRVLGRFNLNGTDPEAESETERSGESSATESDATSGSVEVDDSISLSHSVEEPIPVGLIRSESAKNKVEEIAHVGEREETTTIVPINLENDTLVNENATEDRTNVEPVNEDVVLNDANDDDVVVPTTPSTTQALDERLVLSEDNSSTEAVPVTEIPKLSETEISNDNEQRDENDNPQPRNNDNSDAAPTDPERQSNDDEVVVTESVINQDEVDAVEADLTTTTAIPTTTNSSVTTTSTTPEPVIQSDSNSNSHQNDDESQQSVSENTTSQSEGVTATTVTTPTTTTTTTTVEPNNSLSLNNSTNTSSSSSSSSQTTVDNENELS